MTSYQEFAKYLDHLLDGVQAVRITVLGFIPLSVEEIGSSGDGHRLVSLCYVWTANRTATSCAIQTSCFCFTLY